MSQSQQLVTEIITEMRCRLSSDLPVTRADRDHWMRMLYDAEQAVTEGTQTRLDLESHQLTMAFGSSATWERYRDATLTAWIRRLSAIRWADPAPVIYEFTRMVSNDLVGVPRAAVGDPAAIFSSLGVVGL